jgi:predicted metal-binding protein
MSQSEKKPKIVSFKAPEEGISQAFVQQLLEKGKPYGINAIFPFSVDKIQVAQWVQLKCRYGCSRYNTNWCCPPATPEPEKVREILSEYSMALLLVGTTHCVDFYLDNNRKRANQVRCWKGSASLERMLFLKGYYKAFSLVGECCALCKTCAFPEECRFPQEKRPSIESFSIDAIGTLRHLGISPRVANHKDDRYSYYGIILLE